ncbi:MAG: hypothetical protein GC200_09540 [Tepidisphaera sp.]|nr:hypothetical protein [Tepidisphaera sp.]
MLDNFRLAASVVWRVLFAPLWVTWRGYRILWWAFDSDPRRAGASASLAPRNAPPPPGDAPLPASADPSQAPPMTTSPPLAALRGGYIASLLASAFIAFPTRLAVASHHLSPAAGWLTWGWATLAVAVASLFFVRHVAREHAKRQPVGRFAQARASLAGVGVALASSGRGITRVAGAAGKLGASAARATRAAWTSAPASRARAGIGSLASRLRRPAQAKATATNA